MSSGFFDGGNGVGSWEEYKLDRKVTTMKLLNTYFFSILFLTSCGQTTTPENNLVGNEEEFKQAYSVYQTDKISCEKKLIDYTKKYPNDYKGWSLLGAVTSELNKDSLANIFLTKALEVNPKDYMALTGLGVLERKKKNYDKAADYYNQALAIEPNFGRAYGGLMLIELKRGNYAKAVELGEKGIALEPEALYMKGQLSLAYHLNNQLDKRDKLIKELTEKKYPYVENYKNAFKGKVSLDDL